MEIFSRVDQRDEGFLKGTAGVIKLLKEIITEGDDYK